eukprot:scaffold21306_cov58-Phaeocystis_antarctica.AAC.2
MTPCCVKAAKLRALSPRESGTTHASYDLLRESTFSGVTSTAPACGTRHQSKRPWPPGLPPRLHSLGAARRPAACCLTSPEARRPSRAR